MVRVKTLKLRILAQFAIIIAPVTLILIFQAISDVRRTATIESIVERHGLARAAKDNFESFVTLAADAVETGSLGRRAHEALLASSSVLRNLSQRDKTAAPVAAGLESLAAQVSTGMPLGRLLALQGGVKQTRDAIRAMAERYDHASSETITLSIESARQQSVIVAWATVLTLLVAAWFIYSTIIGVTEPLNAAVDLAGKIAAGEFGDEAQPPRKRDLGNLLGSLDLMRTKLRQSQSEIEAYQRDLEAARRGAHRRGRGPHARVGAFGVRTSGARRSGARGQFVAGSRDGTCHHRRASSGTRGGRRRHDLRVRRGRRILRPAGQLRRQRSHGADPARLAHPHRRRPGGHLRLEAHAVSGARHRDLQLRPAKCLAARRHSRRRGRTPAARRPCHRRAGGAAQDRRRIRRLDREPVANAGVAIRAGDRKRAPVQGESGQDRTAGGVEPAEVAVPGQHVARVAHTAQCHHRHHRDAAGGCTRLQTRRRGRTAGPGIARLAAIAGTDQRHPGSVQDRSREDGCPPRDLLDRATDRRGDDDHPQCGGEERQRVAGALPRRTSAPCMPTRPGSGRPCST